MATEEKIVSELLDALSTVCELDKETISVLRPELFSVVHRNMTALSVPVPSVEKVKVSRSSSKRVPKSDKIPHKNAYHFFVASKMGEVKDAGVGAKERMKTIGEMWKKLPEEGRLPFQEKAQHYNQSVDSAMSEPDWASRREDIVSSANQSAGVAKKVSVPSKEVEEEEVEEEEEEVEESAPVPVPVPVPEVKQSAPVRRRK